MRDDILRASLVMSGARPAMIHKRRKSSSQRCQLSYAATASRVQEWETRLLTSCNSASPSARGVLSITDDIIDDLPPFAQLRIYARSGVTCWQKVCCGSVRKQALNSPVECSEPPNRQEPMVHHHIQLPQGGRHAAGRLFVTSRTRNTVALDMSAGRTSLKV